MLRHALLISWHFSNPSDRIPREGLLFPHPKHPRQVKALKCMWKSYLCECASQTGNNSFERTTCPSSLLHCWTQRAPCFGDCVWTPIENIPVTSLCHPSPPATLCLQAQMSSLSWSYPKCKSIQEEGKSQREKGEKPQVLSLIPWLSFPRALLRNVPPFNTY